MFTDSYYPAVDGVVVSLNNTSRELMRQGHDVVIFAPSPRADCKINGIDDNVVWLPSMRFGSYQGYRNALFPSGIVSQIRREAPDIIHSHGISFAGIQAMIASRQTGIKNVLTYHTMLTEAASFYSPRIMPLDVILQLAWIYQRNYLRRPHALIVPTNAIKSELQSHGIEARRWEVIPTGVDCKRFSPENYDRSIRDRFFIQDEKMILTVGRLAKEKNLELIIKGFSELLKLRQDVKLLIVGKGPAEAEYRDIVKRMNVGDHVIFAGFIPDSELPKFYATCDAFVIASRFETQGLVTLEAMASGKPVAGINHRAIPEIVKDGENGYLFDNDPGSLSQALSRAVADQDGVSENARKTAEQFCIENCTSRLISLYEELVKK